MIEQTKEGVLSAADLAETEERKTQSIGGPKGTAMAREDERAPLFVAGEAQDFRSKWERIQTGFVDEPRKAVQDADALVAAAMKRLAEIFSDERSNLERDWDRGDNVSTEDVRVALRRYRSFFDRLLSV